MRAKSSSVNTSAASRPWSHSSRQGGFDSRQPLQRTPLAFNGFLNSRVTVSDRYCPCIWHEMAISRANLTRKAPYSISQRKGDSPLRCPHEEPTFEITDLGARQSWAGLRARACRAQISRRVQKECRTRLASRQHPGLRPPALRHHRESRRRRTYRDVRLG